MWDRARIVIQSLNGGERAILMEGGSDARYVPTGHIVYAAAGVLFARPFDLRELRMTGGPVPIVEGVRRGGGTGTGSLVGIGGASTHFSVSDTGTLVYVPGPLSASTVQRLAIGDRDGVIEPLKLQPGLYQFPRSSPEGKRIVFGTDDRTDAIIWVYKLWAVQSPMRQLTFEGRNRYPIWSGDGQWIAYQSDRRGIWRYFASARAELRERGTPTKPVRRIDRPETLSRLTSSQFNITSGSKYRWQPCRPPTRRCRSFRESTRPSGRTRVFTGRQVDRVCNAPSRSAVCHALRRVISADGRKTHRHRGRAISQRGRLTDGSSLHRSEFKTTPV